MFESLSGTSHFATRIFKTLRIVLFRLNTYFFENAVPAPKTANERGWHN